MSEITGLDILKKKDFILYNTVIIKGARHHIQKFEAPPTGRGGNGLIYYLSGKVHCHMRDMLPRIGLPGDLIYLPNEVQYTCVFENEGKQSEFILINFEITDESLRPIRLCDTIQIVRPVNSMRFHAQFTDVLQLYGLGTTPPARIKARIMDILTQFSQELNHEEEQGKQFGGIEPGINYLEQHFTRNIPIQQLADKCFVSESTFRRLFRVYTGISPVHYRNMLRASRAKELLRTGMLSTEEVAEQLGFYDTAYLCKIFKKETGMSIGAYKRELRANNRP